MPVLTVTSGVIGPQMVVTVAIESEDATAAVEAAVTHSGARLVVVPRRPDGSYAKVGTVAQIEQDGQLPQGGRAAVLRGVHRAELGAGATGPGQALWIEAHPLTAGDASSGAGSQVTVSSPEVDGLVRRYRVVLEAILEHRGARSLADALSGINEPGAVADLALYSPDLDFDQKIMVLETLDVAERLRLVLGWATETLHDLQLTRELRDNLQGELASEQRQAVLRRQLAAIRKELGEGADPGDQVDAYRQKLTGLADAGAPHQVTAALQRELDKLANTPTQSPEHGWISAWLDTVFELPWTTRATQSIDLAQARAVLDADHAGLERVKERIIEFLAVRKLRQDRGLDHPQAGTVGADAAATGSILLLVGPPGVGKTSLGASIARTLGRPFGRLSLGGVRDEAEIRGHRRTYVGARPGRLVRALTEAGAMNPVLLLDELDKLGSDWRGDPSSALLEVLDPAQNHTFRDHYLEIDLDLSDVVFIATANQLDTVPGPLLDRLEIISLEGYIDQEKAAIARHHLLPRLQAQLGLTAGEVQLTDPALAAIIRHYTREAGVRDLERRLAALLRKLVARLDGNALVVDETVDETTVRELLGKPRFQDDTAERPAGVPGLATGLAVTGVGGDVLSIEAATMAGEPGLTLTGQLGEVMRESAEIARSYVRSHRQQLGIDATVDTARLHLHVPAGAVPKDGPSAGITMTTALVSLLSGRPVRPEVAMTGEMTLTGRVLPIGGVRQKLLAAHRAGITKVVIPRGNEADLDELPEVTRQALEVHLASHIEDVLALALAPVAPAVGAAA
ncbi:MAG: endopeptidase La [Acidimicrobiales bacterium]